MTDNENLSSICYKKNYLSEVIARIDLVSPVIELKDQLPKEISSEALEYFPIAEPSRAFTQNVLVGANDIATNRDEFTEWNFFGLNRKNRLTFIPGAFYVSFSEYQKYEELRDKFLSIENSFFSKYPEAQPKRLGLRYINQLELQISDPLDWSGFVNQEILGLFKINIFQDSKPTRIFHNYETKIDDFYLRFQFGVHNPDYPSPIRRNIFILDYDAYYQGLIDLVDIPTLLNKFHSSIQNVFEVSITDKLREIMNGTT